MVSSRRQHTTPFIFVDTDQASSASPLKRLRLEATGEGAGRYNEAWLQHQIHAHPELLPITEIEPAFLPIIPVCLELPNPRGSIDNFFVTPTGNLVFAECKLWRNPEARRHVIAQVMDYIDGLTSWGYEDLEKAVRAAVPSGNSETPSRLYEFVGEADQELEESEFIDAVSRNLRLGRGLFLIVGDGIKEEAEALALHLQAHAGVHFALALVELAMFSLPDGNEILVQPRVIARTVNIERGIVRIEDERISVAPPKETEGKQPETLSEEEFYDKLDERVAGLAGRLRKFVERLQPLGITKDLKKTLSLRWHASDGTAFNVATIYINGETYTGHVNSAAARQHGLIDITHAYVRELAETIQAEVRHSEKDEVACWVSIDGHNPQIEMMLEHEDAWVQALERLATRIDEKLEADVV